MVGQTTLTFKTVVCFIGVRFSNYHTFWLVSFVFAHFVMVLFTLLKICLHTRSFQGTPTSFRGHTFFSKSHFFTWAIIGVFWKKGCLAGYFFVITNKCTTYVNKNARRINDLSLPNHKSITYTKFLKNSPRIASKSPKRTNYILASNIG